MQLIAKLHALLPLVTGNGKNGTWKKQEFVVETDGQYPKKVLISVWGDKIDMSAFTPGTSLKIDLDLESREYNGRWYTDAKAWRVEQADGSAPVAGPVSNAMSSSSQPTPPVITGDVDDLPF